MTNIATISFFASFVGSIGMISVKYFELKTGKKLWFALLVQRHDNMVHKAYSGVRKFFSYFNKHNAILFIQWIIVSILSWIRSFYIWVRAKAHAHPPSKKVIDMVRGKGNIVNNGGASFYLKKISEDGKEIIK